MTGRDLASRRLTVDLGGTTVDGTGSPRDELPAGLRWHEASVELGPVNWADVSAALLGWQVKTRSGFTVVDETGAETARPVDAGARHWIVARVGPVRIHEPVEIVRVVEEADRVGFAYGTLAGHPVSGEEAFVLERHAGGGIWFTNRSISGPARGCWRAAFPVARLAQPIYQRRYLRALQSRP